ncbi:hypothetical protein [Gordonia insulae]|uniref:Mce-associated membrane protein n=1 Tax=Gordonia insulae TaxID=2420509 RepID=A0A3G8JF02_9ACTN|nr:hypothetical protein [Gordonia insulae]AZG43574.1 hypothetical protein D7316_00142 [Gordonia insulae]
MPKSQRPPDVGESDAASDDVTPLDGADFLAANRVSREQARIEAQQKADRRTPGKVDPPSRPRRRWTSGWRRPRMGVVAIILAVFVVVLGASTAYFAHAYVQQRDQVEAAGPSPAQRQEAMDVAREYATTLATYDPADYGDLDRRIREISTPEFAKTYITSSQEARRGNATARGTSRAEAKEAGLQSISDGKAVVLVALDQTVTSPQVSAEVPDGIPYQSRVKVTLDRRDGRWLLADFDTV